MLLTVSEAAGKTCPQMSGYVPGQNLGDVAQYCYAGCVSCDCLAWRWYEKAILITRKYSSKWMEDNSYTGPMAPSDEEQEWMAKALAALDLWEVSKPPDPEKGWKLTNKFIDWDEAGDFVAIYERAYDPERRGYCGLAGKPEMD